MALTPGLVVQTGARSGPAGVVRAPSGNYFTVGLTERGPVDKPQAINSLAHYRRVFGERVTYGALYDDLQVFFESGGAQAFVQRVVGPAATSGQLSLMDTGGTPVATLRATATSGGAWSSQVSVAVEAGSQANTKRITVLLNDAVVDVADNIVSPADAVARFALNPYVRLSDLGSASVAPANLPANIAATPLAAGTDDRAAITTTVLTEALGKFRVGLGDGAVAAPGYGPTMHAALMAHAATHRRIALLTGAKGATRDQLISLALPLANATGATVSGLFGGWIQVSDGVGGVRVISPEGYIAGARNRAHEAGGPWNAAAGENAVSQAVLGSDVEFTTEDAERLNNARVNPLRLIQNVYRLYGWRSLSAAEADYGSLTVGDTMNRLVTEAERLLEPFVHNRIDGRGQIYAAATGVLIGLMEVVRSAGGVYEQVVNGEVVDPGYSVNVSQDLNPESVIVNNELRAAIAVRLAPSASTITLMITKVGVNAAV